MKNVAHPVDRTNNQCIGGCWFILANFLGCAFNAHSLKVVSIPWKAMLASGGKKIIPQMPNKFHCI